MSHFSPEWLTLRESADQASRNAKVLNACAKTFANKNTLKVCDLGAGTGASVRALAHLLPAHQQWTLVDHDAENLKHALENLAAWGDASKTKNNVIDLEHHDQRITAEIFECDLTSDTTFWRSDTELVTASALLDLVSPDWIARTVKAASENHVSILATLNFDGQLQTNPVHPFDERVFNAFRKHQRTDKGFGSAAGPDASAFLKKALVQVDYTVVCGDSPWRMTTNTQKLMHETLNGMAIAATEIGTLSSNEIREWLSDRLSNTKTLTIGHQDIFAVPKIRSISG